MNLVVDEVCGELGIDVNLVRQGPSGSRATTFVLPNGLILRLNDRADAPFAYRNERAILRDLTDLQYIPRLVAYGSVDKISWQVTTRLDGVPVAQLWGSLTTAQRTSLVNVAAYRLWELHSLRIPSETGMSWSAPSVLRGSLEAGLTSGRLFAADSELIEKAAKQINWVPNEEKTFVHGDWHFGNVLSDGEKVTGVVDFEWSGRSVEARDLCIGDFFDEVAPGSWLEFFECYERLCAHPEDLRNSVIAWTIIWKTYQTAHRVNTHKARDNRSNLISLCQQIVENKDRFLGARGITNMHIAVGGMHGRQ